MRCSFGHRLHGEHDWHATRVQGQDCDNDGILDACETDCNFDGVPDDCQKLVDCDSNGQPDECEAFEDCNSTGIPDSCELEGNDCDGNGVPDECPRPMVTEFLMPVIPTAGCLAATPMATASPMIAM